jgi:hypothetical protein
LKAQIEDKFEYLELDFSNFNKFKNLRLETKFPFFSFKIFEEDKEIIYTNGPGLLQSMKNRINAFFNNLDLKVLYIGQSYGIEGARTAPDRLKSHSTMQAIFEEANKNNPDKDVLLALFTFKEWLLMSFDGTMKLSEEEKQVDQQHLDNVTYNILGIGITEQQEINFTEAALIRYFKPEYNDKFKETFPNPAHITYSECYDLDINSVCIELLTESIRCMFYSDEIERDWSHYPLFNLHSKTDRKGMFEL